jgi:hypothetical protein
MLSLILTETYHNPIFLSSSLWRYILFSSKRHPKELGAEEVEAFLTHLAVVGQVSASTQNQALSALLFLYKEVLSIDLP